MKPLIPIVSAMAKFFWSAYDRFTGQVVACKAMRLHFGTITVSMSAQKSSVQKTNRDEKPELARQYHAWQCHFSNPQLQLSSG